MANRRFRGSAGNNKKRGGDFLLQNAQKNGIIETESGLQYTIIEKTNGDMPHEDSQVVFHQRVLLLNGTILEDSYKTNKPAEARVSELLEGLAEVYKKCRLAVDSNFGFHPIWPGGKKEVQTEYRPTQLFNLTYDYSK